MRPPVWTTLGKQTRTGEKTDLKINGEVIKQFPREKGYPYLGHFINLNSTWEEQMHLLDETFITRLEAIDKAPLPITAKIEAINIMICSVLESKICNTCLPLQKLKYYEDLIVNRVRKWLGLGTNANRKFMFVARSKGGLGLRNPTNMYIARKISFMVEMLNSDDNQVRFTKENLSSFTWINAKWISPNLTTLPLAGTK